MIQIWQKASQHGISIAGFLLENCETKVWYYVKSAISELKYEKIKVNFSKGKDSQACLILVVK